jgi:Holliday junction DNA helicase RuvA
MLDRLRGRLTGTGKDFVVVECSGVGFRVHTSSATLKDLPPEGEEVAVKTHLHFREGGVDLYGFSSETEREIFLAMIGVGGVGPRSALAVLSSLGVPGVLAASAREDAAAFTRAQGIGKKLAQRIAMELPDRLKKIAVEFAPAVAAGEGDLPSSAEAEAVLALVALGFARGEAQVAVTQTRRESGETPAEVLVKESLRRLSGRRR